MAKKDGKSRSNFSDTDSGGSGERVGEKVKELVLVD